MISDAYLNNPWYKPAKKRQVNAMRAKSIAKNPEEFCFFRASYSEPVLTIRWERKNALDLIAAGGPG